MKKHLLTFGICLCATFSLSAQINSTLISDAEIISIAHQRGIAEVDIPGFILHYKNENKIISENTNRNVLPAAPTYIVNSGFETGDFTAWQGAIGDNTISSNGPLQNIQVGIFSLGMDAQLNDQVARHTIMSPASGNDTSGGFPIVPPGCGNYIARLSGVSQTFTGNYMGEILEQSFVVNANQPYVKINYAVVLNDGGHLAGESPYFKYELIDSLQNQIAFRYDEMVNNPVGYLLSSTTASTNYLPWQSDSVSLVNYIGQNITLRFTVAGCIYSGHFGYCYVDIFDSSNLQSISETNKNAFQIFPNPSNGIINMNMEGNLIEKRNITITNLLGQPLHVPMIQTAQGWQIDLGAENSGMYFITVNSLSGISTQRIIVR